MLDVPSSDSATCVDKLAERLKILFANRDNVKITRPCKMAELRISDMDDAADWRTTGDN